VYGLTSKDDLVLSQGSITEWLLALW